MRILIAEPDQNLYADLSDSGGLARQVRVVRDGQNALASWQTWHPDVAVIDSTLPDVDAFELLKQMRASSQTVVVLLANRAAEDELIRALEVGADAFVSKPVSPRVLHASIDAVLRRVQQRVSPPLPPSASGALVLDPTWHSATWNGDPVQLTRHQFRILQLLASGAGNVVSYRELIDANGLASPKRDLAPFSVEVARLVNHIARIRAKLVAAGAPPQALVAVRGRGYRLSG